MASPQVVLLFTHSKGGVDALVGLVNHPEVMSKVKGIISIQSPYLGTPIADYLHSTQPWRGLAYMILSIIGGSGESLWDLSSEQRVKWYQSNLEAIYNIQRHIPILSVGTWKNNTKGIDSTFELSRNIMKKNMDIDSDGLVPWKSAILPGGPYVAIEGLDHASVVVSDTYIRLDKQRFTQALLNTFSDLQ